MTLEPTYPLFTFYYVTFLPRCPVCLSCFLTARLSYCLFINPYFVCLSLCSFYPVEAYFSFELPSRTHPVIKFVGKTGEGEMNVQLFLTISNSKRDAKRNFIWNILGIVDGEDSEEKQWWCGGWKKQVKNAHMDITVCVFLRFNLYNRWSCL